MAGTIISFLAAGVIALVIAWGTYTLGTELNLGVSPVVLPFAIIGAAFIGLGIWVAIRG